MAHTYSNLKEAIQDYVSRADTIVKRVESQGRKMTDAEREQVKELLDSVNEFKVRQKQGETAKKEREAYENDPVAKAEVARQTERLLNGGMHFDDFASKALKAGLSPGQPSVTMSAVAALGVKTTTFSGDSETWQPAVESIGSLGQDSRFVYRNLPITNAGDDTSVNGFRVTSRDLESGDEIQRDIDATTEKAELNVAIEYDSVKIPQFAILISDIPNAALETPQGLRDILNSEARYAVEQALDAAVYASVIDTADNFNTGADLIAQIRGAIGVMRAAGQNPDLLIVDPVDAAALDLTVSGADDLYVFSLRASGSASPLFDLRVVEATAATGSDPHLVDSRRIGRTHLGAMRIDLDPFSGFSRNVSTIRCETRALFWRRDPSAVLRIGA